MKFNAIATPTQAGFDEWVANIKAQGNKLTKESYYELAEPTEKHPVTYYGDVEKGLFHTIMMKFMVHMSGHNSAEDIKAMDYKHSGHSEHTEHSEHSGHSDHAEHSEHSDHSEHSAHSEHSEHSEHSSHTKGEE